MSRRPSGSSDRSGAPSAAEREAKLEELTREAERLQKVVDELIPVEASAKAANVKTAEDVDSAELKLTEATAAIEVSGDAISGARGERKRAQAKVNACQEQIDSARKLLRKLGASGRGTNEAALPATAEAAAEEGPEEEKEGEGAESVKKLTSRQLGEIKELKRPPTQVRRALEVVQALLLAAEGDDDPVSDKDTPWETLMTMLSRSDFIRRILDLKPLAISHRPAVLKSFQAKWPHLASANDSEAPTGRAGWKKLNKAAADARRASTQDPAAEKADKRRASTQDPAEKAAPAAGAASAFAKAGKKPAMAALVKAAAADAPSADGSTLTVEAVEYASKPCGAIFRWCASVISQSFRIAAEREAAQAALDAALREMVGAMSALSATDSFREQIEKEEAQLEATKKAAAEALVKAREADAIASREHSKAAVALDEAKAAAAKAALLAKQEADAQRRRQEELERRRRDKADANRVAQEAIERDLATRPAEPQRKELAWLQEHRLPDIKPIEFAVGAAALPPDSHSSLTKVAKALQGAPSLKLHIAGHIQGDEDPKLSSQRAQAVGAALIALGAVPSRLRAKGYGATVGVSSASKIRMRLKSERRVGLHAISEVGTRHGIEFDSKGTDVTERSTPILKELAKLLTTNSTMRMSVEGHTDDVGDPSENAKLSIERAQAVCKLLIENGIAATRLVAHGFGATLPLVENGSEENRMKNRRVQFLVIPDVTRVSPKSSPRE